MNLKDKERLYVVVESEALTAFGPPDESNEHWTLDLGNLQYLIPKVIEQLIAEGRLFTSGTE